MEIITSLSLHDHWTYMATPRIHICEISQDPPARELSVIGYFTCHIQIKEGLREVRTL